MDEKDTVVIEQKPNGPYIVTGKFSMRENGQLVEKQGPVALCRCGHSNKKPFCDGSHRAADFKAA